MTEFAASREAPKRGSILAGPLKMLLITCGIVGALAYCGCSDRVVASSLLLPATILWITLLIVRETIRAKQLVLLGSEG